MDKTSTLFIKIRNFIKFNTSKNSYLGDMWNSIVKKKLWTLSILFLIVVGGIFLFTKNSAYLKSKATEGRKAQIAIAAKKVFNKCQDVSTFDKRRECFKDKLLEMRKQSNIVKLDYILVVNDKAISAKSEDLGDLVKLTIPKEMGFIRCVSNTFFFDWSGESMYLSLENPFGGAQCTTIKDETVLVYPKDLTADQQKLVKQMFGNKIN